MITKAVYVITMLYNITVIVYITRIKEEGENKAVKGVLAALLAVMTVYGGITVFK